MCARSHARKGAAPGARTDQIHADRAWARRLTPAALYGDVRLAEGQASLGALHSSRARKGAVQAMRNDWRVSWSRSFHTLTAGSRLRLRLIPVGSTRFEHVVIAGLWRASTVSS